MQSFELPRHEFSTDVQVVDMVPPTRMAGQKRKPGSERPAQSSNTRKRQKLVDARVIPVQHANATASAKGELNVASFIKAREFEIGALEKSMQKSRKALVTRAFQQVPRHMRRRTASHNVKKVPRRLRRRAEREVSRARSCRDGVALTGLTRMATDEGRQHSYCDEENTHPLAQTETTNEHRKRSQKAEQQGQNRSPEKERGQCRSGSARSGSSGHASATTATEEE